MLGDRDLEHPDITHIMKYGYPPNEEPEEREIFCDECGCELEEDNTYEDEDHKYLCKSCLLFFHEKRWC